MNMDNGWLKIAFGVVPIVMGIGGIVRMSNGVIGDVIVWVFGGVVIWAGIYTIISGVKQLKAQNRDDE